MRDRMMKLDVRCMWRFPEVNSESENNYVTIRENSRWWEMGWWNQMLDMQSHHDLNRALSLFSDSIRYQIRKFIVSFRMCCPAAVLTTYASDCLIGYRHVHTRMVAPGDSFFWQSQKLVLWLSQRLPHIVETLFMHIFFWDRLKCCRVSSIVRI